MKTAKSENKCHVYTVYHVNNFFKETGDICDYLKTGRPYSICIKNMVNAVLRRIARNSICKQKLLSQEMNLVPRTVSGVLREDLDFRAYKGYT